MKQKTAIITGESRGIGRAVAISLAKKKYYVTLIADDAKHLMAVANEIKKLGHHADYYIFDIANVRKVQSCIKDIIAKHSHIDVLFNNAGIFFQGTS